MAEILLGREPTIGAAVAAGRERLAAAGCDTPRLDAELLLASVLNPPAGRERLVIDRHELLPAPAWPPFRGAAGPPGGA